MSHLRYAMKGLELLLVLHCNTLLCKDESVAIDVNGYGSDAMQKVHGYTL